MTEPSTIAFYAALLLVAIAVGPVAFAWRRPRLPQGVLKAGVSLSVFLFAWLVVELLLRGLAAARAGEEVVPVLTYEEAQADPAAFRRWHQHRIDNFLKIIGTFGRRDPSGLTPYALIPGIDFVRHRSRVHINSLGFRGAEIERDKGGRFRIVAIGESTTFGLTLLPDDRPWPEALEDGIRSRLDCRTPVQVVNAGVPAWNLNHQLARLERDILPLEPDVILAYHGNNGFHLFLQELPSMRVHAAPARPRRPSLLLQYVERELRLAWFRRRYNDARALDLARIRVDPLDNAYARAYVRLIEKARGAGAEPVLSTFNLAVDADSPEPAIRFYEATVPDLQARIVANQIHTRVVRAVGRVHDVAVIDTSPGLDGAYREAYVDIMHFTEAGRERLARNMLDGLKDVLAAQPRPACRPRPGLEARSAASG